MRGLAVVLGVLAGCYSPSVPEAVPCGANRTCPSGQMCDVDDRCRSTLIADADVDAPDVAIDPDAPDAAIDAAIDAGIDGPAIIPDTDGDGFKDNVDNCPMISNVDQRDHDTDTVGDVCDNCPHIANVNQARVLDTDQVGDACDPNNGRADTLFLFEGFYATPTGWTLPTGYSVANGKLVGVAANSTQIVAYKDQMFPANLTVVLGGSMTLITGTTPNIGAVARHTAITGEFYRCAVLDVRAEIARHVAFTVNTLDQQMLVAPDLTNITIGMDITGGQVGCATKAGNIYGLMGTDNTPLTGSRAGVRVRASTGTFDYFVVYSH